MTQCTHRFHVDGQNIGTCSLCGEVRQFPYDKGEPVKVLKKGDPNSSLRRKAKEETTSKGFKQRRAIGWRKHNQDRHRYYEANKEAIIADFLTIGTAATRDRWNIPKPTAAKLARRWLTKHQPPQTTPRPGSPPATPHKTPLPSTNPTPSNGRLPPFPQFSDTWAPEVQLQWFEVYSELALAKPAQRP